MPRTAKTTPVTVSLLTAVIAQAVSRLPDADKFDSGACGEFAYGLHQFLTQHGVASQVFTGIRTEHDEDGPFSDTFSHAVVEALGTDWDATGPDASEHWEARWDDLPDLSEFDWKLNQNPSSFRTKFYAPKFVPAIAVKVAAALESAYASVEKDKKPRLKEAESLKQFIRQSLGPDNLAAALAAAEGEWDSRSLTSARHADEIAAEIAGEVTTQFRLPEADAETILSHLFKRAGERFPGDWGDDLAEAKSKHPPQAGDEAEPCLPGAQDPNSYLWPVIKQRRIGGFTYKYGRLIHPKDEVVGDTTAREPAPQAQQLAQKLLGLGEGIDAKKIIRQATANQRVAGGWLDTELADVDPELYTFFDCWNDAGEQGMAEAWAWNSPQATDLARALCAQLGQITGFDFLPLARLYPDGVRTRDHWFDKVGRLLVRLGYYVYFSESAFEVYASSSLTAAERASARPYGDCDYPAPVDAPPLGEGIDAKKIIRQVTQRFRFDPALVAKRIRAECPWCLDRGRDRFLVITWIGKNKDLFPHFQDAIDVIVRGAQHYAGWYYDSHAWCFDDARDIYRFFKALGLYSEDVDSVDWEPPKTAPMSKPARSAQ